MRPYTSKRSQIVWTAPDSEPVQPWLESRQDRSESLTPLFDMAKAVRKRLNPQSF